MNERIQLDDVKQDAERASLTFDGSGVSIPVWTDVELRAGDIIEIEWSGTSRWGSTANAAWLILDEPVLLFRKSAEYREAERLKYKATETIRKERAWVVNGSKLKLDVLRLAEPFRERCMRFMREAGGWKQWHVAGAEYEVFCCTEAQRIVEYAQERGMDGAAVRTYARHTHAELDALGLTLDTGHSGNTWGGAFGLAAAVLEGTEI